MNNKLVFATNNEHKLQEVRAMLPHFDVVSLMDINCFETIEETATTLEGNASIKANYITEKFQLPAFGDDTGLEVKALNNAPGVYSARYAGQHCNAQDNMLKLLTEMKGETNRQAQFRTVIALNIDDKHFFFEGVCKGEITTIPKGDSGFGYDPIFKPEGFDTTFAEMNMHEKGKISHRGKAIVKLINFLNNYNAE